MPEAFEVIASDQVLISAINSSVFQENSTAVKSELLPEQFSRAYMEPSPRKRGRPRIPLTEDVLERRRLAKQRSNSRRSEATATRGQSMVITSQPSLLPIRRRGGVRELGCFDEPEARPRSSPVIWGRSEVSRPPAMNSGESAA
ncbi:hypothetical protein AgCh_033566 [Apium graveolens]